MENVIKHWTGQLKKTGQTSWTECPTLLKDERVDERKKKQFLFN